MIKIECFLLDQKYVLRVKISYVIKENVIVGISVQ